MTLESLLNLISVALGFAIAGMCCSAYQLATSKLPTFGLLNSGASLTSVAAIPLLVFSAPFLIMRNTIAAATQEGRRFEFVFVATVLAGFWSLMSGTVVLMTLRAVGILVA